MFNYNLNNVFKIKEVLIVFFNIGKGFTYTFKALWPNLFTIATQQLNSEIEGTCKYRYGLILTITSEDFLSKGKVSESSGYLVFNVKYKAIIFKPIKSSVKEIKDHNEYPTLTKDSNSNTRNSNINQQLNLNLPHILNITTSTTFNNGNTFNERIVCK
ncbi:hypothetical protein ACTFIV_006432 [Dictyostelium citrinum]